MILQYLHVIVWLMHATRETLAVLMQMTLPTRGQQQSQYLLENGWGIICTIYIAQQHDILAPHNVKTERVLSVQAA